MKHKWSQFFKKAYQIKCSQTDLQGPISSVRRNLSKYLTGILFSLLCQKGKSVQVVCIGRILSEELQH